MELQPLTTLVCLVQCLIEDEFDVDQTDESRQRKEILRYKIQEYSSEISSILSTLNPN